MIPELESMQPHTHSNLTIETIAIPIAFSDTHIADF